MLAATSMSGLRGFLEAMLLNIDPHDPAEFLAQTAEDGITCASRAGSRFWVQGAGFSEPRSCLWGGIFMFHGGPAERQRGRDCSTRLLGADKGRIHGFNVSVAHIWAEQARVLEKAGQRMPVEDSYIAATARRHGFTITNDPTRARVKSFIERATRPARP